MFQLLPGVVQPGLPGFEMDKPGFGYTQPVNSIFGGVMGGIPGFPAMPGLPGMPGFPSLSTSTSSNSSGGDQSASGDFTSHGINFGTSTHGASANWLLWGAGALAVYWLLVRK